MDKWLGAILLTAMLPVALAAQSTTIADSVRSPGLVGNVFGDNPVRPLFVYLPPTYKADSGKHFPVLYLLHGASSVPEEWWSGVYQGMDLRVTLDSLMTTHAIPDFIVVMPDANNKLGASFYANSPVAGNWEDFIAHDVVHYVDKHYRTIRSARARALVGHSMGGFGALAIGFDHPSSFGMVYALSPCCWTFVGPFAPSSPVWAAVSKVERWQDAADMTALLFGMATALDGDKNSRHLYRGLPYGADSSGTIVADSQALARWLEHAPPARASAMIRRGEHAPSIVMEAGSKETLIRDGIHSLRARLDSLGIKYSDSVFTGAHTDHVREDLTQRVLPLVGKWFASVMRS